MLTGRVKTVFFFFSLNFDTMENASARLKLFNVQSFFHWLIRFIHSHHSMTHSLDPIAIDFVQVIWMSNLFERWHFRDQITMSWSFSWQTPTVWWSEGSLLPSMPVRGPGPMAEPEWLGWGCSACQPNPWKRSRGYTTSGLILHGNTDSYIQCMYVYMHAPIFQWMCIHV